MSCILAHPRSLPGSFLKETGINRSLAHASGSVRVVPSTAGALVKIFLSLKRQRESNSGKSIFS